MIKVRFAPSPTGYLHIGGGRTALFNWMYARAQKGCFVLRVEDTDLERSKKEYYDEILLSMKWLGLEWDELYRQSERFDIYREHAQKLVEQGKAYKEGDAVILSMPADTIKIYDIIRGEIEFDTELLKDEVLMKSDGSPTYSFACVVDDALMGISHVIRGEDHIPNTPKQIMIYTALGFKVPKFAHLPLIMGEDGSRLSKRTGAVAVSDYKTMGFLPEALVNYLMLLGWSPGENQEIISLENAVKKFSIKKINKSAAVFSLEKLTWVNEQYIKVLDPKQLYDLVVPFLREKGYIGDDYDRRWIESIVQLYQRRTPTLAAFIDRTQYIFEERITIDKDAQAQYLEKDLSKEFNSLREKMSTVDPFEAALCEDAFRTVVSDLGIQASELVHPVRVALTGTTVGIGLFETMALLGKEKVLQRLKEATSIH